jgi:hypothetical protein
LTVNLGDAWHFLLILAYFAAVLALRSPERAQSAAAK